MEAEEGVGADHGRAAERRVGGEHRVVAGLAVVGEGCVVVDQDALAECGCVADHGVRADDRAWAEHGGGGDGGGWMHNGEEPAPARGEVFGDVASGAGYANRENEAVAWLGGEGGGIAEDRREPRVAREGVCVRREEPSDAVDMLRPRVACPAIGFTPKPARTHYQNAVWRKSGGRERRGRHAWRRVALGR